MTLQAAPPHFPRMPDQQADVMPGSPLAIVALFTEIVRERFRPGNGLAWTWVDNYTPGEDEENTPDAPRRILIEPAFSSGAESRNVKPAIYIDKGDTSPGKVSIGNLAGTQLRTGLRAFHTLASIPVGIEAVGATKGESAILGDIVWFYILAGREEIRKTFGIHDLSPPILGRTVPGSSDKDQWSTQVSFEIQIDLRWSTLPISPVVNEIVARYKASGEENPDVYLLRQYIR